MVGVGGERKLGGNEGNEGRGEEREGSTFGGVARLVLAPVAEDLVFDPGHVLGVGVVVLLLGPLRHGCGLRLFCLLFLEIRERGRESTVKWVSRCGAMNVWVLSRIDRGRKDGCWMLREMCRTRIILKVSLNLERKIEEDCDYDA